MRTTLFKGAAPLSEYLMSLAVLTDFKEPVPLSPVDAMLRADTARR